MQYENDLNILRQTLDNEEMHIIDKLSHIVAFIRPKNDDKSSSLQAIHQLIDFFDSKEKLATDISDSINLLFIESKISNNITSLGIFSGNGFGHELRERFYNKFLPNPPQKGDFRYIFSTLFTKKDDSVWVDSVDDETWLNFFSSMFSSQNLLEKTKNHLFNELLHTAEILSIWIASEEFDDNFIRLDKRLLNRDSAFIALQRSVSKLVYKIEEGKADVTSTKMDFGHIGVFIEQCNEQISTFKKKSVEYGISVDLIYQLERLTQIIQRLEVILALIENFDTKASSLELIKLFKESVRKNSTKNSLSEIFAQSIRIVAKSIANNTSEHGEHYIASTAKEYAMMFLSASGAGIIIAIMALLKITIVQAEFSEGIQTILASFNYGLGFVLIHLLGFTVATKQPAMTASTFARAIEQEDEKKTANPKKLMELIFQVSRSQFISVVGNVALALCVAFGIAYFLKDAQGGILTDEEAAYYLKGLEPFSALFFAAIAGVWLFFSGLIAGYFDNRAGVLELKQRYYHHPLLKKFLNDTRREKVAKYLHENHGAIAGNFFFGVLLGITPLVGNMFNLPLDIRHVAFSSAYLGYASMHLESSVYEFLFYLACVLLIGMVNLFISFVLALKVSLLSRDVYFGDVFSFLKLLLSEIIKNPYQLIFPYSRKKP